VQFPLNMPLKIQISCTQSLTCFCLQEVVQSLQLNTHTHRLTAIFLVNLG